MNWEDWVISIILVIAMTISLSSLVGFLIYIELDIRKERLKKQANKRKEASDKVTSTLLQENYDDRFYPPLR